MTSLFYDRSGNPIKDTVDWARQFEREDRVVALTRVGFRGAISVSTVWAGVNYRFAGEGPPLIFETMVFGGRHDGEEYRYSTEDQAREGHRAVVRRLSWHGLRHVLELRGSST